MVIQRTSIKPNSLTYLKNFYQNFFLKIAKCLTQEQSSKLCRGPIWACDSLLEPSCYKNDQVMEENRFTCPVRPKCVKMFYTYVAILGYTDLMSSFESSINYFHFITVLEFEILTGCLHFCNMNFRSL